MLRDKYVPGCKHKRRAKSKNGLYWFCVDCQLIVDNPEPPTPRQLRDTANRPWEDE